MTRRVAALILAAGASSRLGQPKQLASLDRLEKGSAPETLLERAMRVACEAGCAPVIAVLGCRAKEIAQGTRAGDAILLHNPQWMEGMASSIRAGIEHVRSEPLAGVLLMTCDQPAVTPAHLQELCAQDIVQATGYPGRRGVPAYFPRSSFAALLALHGEHGARPLLSHAPAVDLPGAELDIDTPQALGEARSQFGSGW